MEYVSAIVDELGHVVCYKKDYSDDELNEILTNHPEWSLKCILV